MIEERGMEGVSTDAEVAAKGKGNSTKTLLEISITISNSLHANFYKLKIR